MDMICKSSDDFNTSQSSEVLIYINFRHDGDILTFLSKHGQIFIKPGHILHLHDNSDEDGTTNNHGWSGDIIIRILIPLFRTHLHLTRRRRNQLMKAYNGNKTPVAPSFNVVAQNIPWYTKPKDVGVCIDKLLFRFRPAIVFISEVEPDLVEANKPPDYTFLRGTLSGKDCVRVCALIKVTEKYEVLEINVEVPTVAIKLLGWTFIGCYREWTWGKDPATNNRRDLELVRLKTLIKYWRRIKGKSLLMGDMNFDPREPRTPHQVSLNGIRGLVEAEITDRGWIQHVQEITRSQSGQAPAILDHLYCNKDDFVEHVYVENTTGTDHYAIGAKIRLTAPVFVSKSFFCRSVKKIPEGAFEHVFCNSRVHEIYSSETVDDAVSSLEQKIVKTLNVVALVRRVQTRAYYAKWLTEDLKLKIKRRNAMRLKAERTGDRADWNVFKAYRKILSKQLREARQADLIADLDVKDSKERWRNVKKHSNMGANKQEDDIELEIDEELVSEPGMVANSLNSYFKEKVVKLRSGLDVSVEKSLEYTDEYLGKRDVEEYEFQQVSRKKVKQIIRNLTNTGATGRDGISTEVLKKYAHVITGPLTHIINMSIYFGVYPSAWKLGHISPLPKGGSRKDPKNWRPICINTAMSKCLETVINDQISSWMESTGLYSRTQHAYRKVRSVSTALIELDTVLRDQLNRGNTCAVLTTDISAGFNLVSKEILIPKMARFGFGELSCQLLKNYLTGRRTRTKVNNIMSAEVELETGVGEGSVLGPNFFSCGMTDIGVVASRVMKEIKDKHGIEVFITQVEYADDTTGLIGAKNESDLQIAVDALLQGFSRFYSVNGLKLNESKCNVMVVRPHIKVNDITCAGEVEVEKIKLLGLHIDNKLSYESHTKIICGRILGKMKHLEALKAKASFRTLKEVTVSLIHSTIEFCAELYLISHRNQVLIQKKLNSVMRMLLDWDFEASCADMMDVLSWLNVHNMRVWCCVRTLKRIMTHPSQTPNLWELVNMNEGPLHNVRYRALKLNWRKNTRWARDSFVSQATDLYNKLGMHGRAFEDYQDMRDKVKSDIVQKFGNKNLK